MSLNLRSNFIISILFMTSSGIIHTNISKISSASIVQDQNLIGQESQAKQQAVTQSTTGAKNSSEESDEDATVASESKPINSEEESAPVTDSVKEQPRKTPLFIPLGAFSELRAWIKLRIPEFFYGQNLNLLNNNNPTDRVFFARHVADLNVEYHFFNAVRENDIIFAKMNIRNKHVWGDPESIASTTISDVKIHNSVVGPHKHGIPRLIFWMREFWIQLSLSEFLHVPFCGYHTLTFGSFPFSVGRGIALGAAFKVDPTDLGYYAEVAVDQYAFGAKLTGVISQECLMYDLYAAFIDNKSVKFSSNNERIRGQQFGHRNYQARGFGVIDYIVAGRLRMTAFARPGVNITFEPYAVYNHNPEMRIEFFGDAVSDLITVGLASESEIGCFEWGFDTAFNLGRQRVRGWDTNFIKIEPRNSLLAEVNAKVRQVPPGQPIPNCSLNPKACKKVPLALDANQNQSIIDVSEQSAGQNCLVIGENSLGTLINDCTRFVDPYYNTYGGSMFVLDFAYNIRWCNFKVAAAYGFASGDINPNRDLEELGDSQIDGDYDGFLGLQETYSGTRVKSAFLLSGPGAVPRIIGYSSESASNPGASLVSRFTNIIFTGTGCTWKPKWSAERWNLNPNILAYWQDVTPGIFDVKNQKFKQSKFADPFLGIELNIFVESEPIDGLRFFGVCAVFFPGEYYKDVKGRPLNRAQQAFIDNQNVTGIINDWVPLLGDDTAYFANLGCEYKF